MLSKGVLSAGLFNLIYG
ncbi:protein YchT [Escherichia coli]|nr:protein YchT [Escherichia coli]